MAALSFLKREEEAFQEAFEQSAKLARFSWTVRRQSNFPC